MRVCWTQSFFPAIILLFSLSLVLSACGNKGPLYLPTENSSLIIDDQVQKEKKQNQEIKEQ